MLSGGLSRVSQAAAGGSLARSFTLTGAMAPRVMYLPLWTAHSSFCSSRFAPIDRVMAASLGKMPTTSVQRLVRHYEQRIDVSQAMIQVAMGSFLLRRIAH